MLKFLWMILTVILMGCTDYAAQLEDEYGAIVDALPQILPNQNIPVYQSSNSMTYYSFSQSSSSVANVAVCYGIYTYDPQKEFCSKQSAGNYIVETFCNTSCWSSDYSECSSCLKGVSCNGFPYNPKKFACVSGELHQRCGASFYGHWFEALWNSCI